MNGGGYSAPCECMERSESLVAHLVTVWEASVRATHRFLSEEDILHIKGQVPDAIRGAERLFTVSDADGRPVAFMGTGRGELEVLFVHPDSFGCGIGRSMVEYAVSHCGVERLYVNEDNPRAIGFYEHCGFAIAGRRECDGHGNRFPLLRMERAAEKVKMKK